MKEGVYTIEPALISQRLHDIMERELGTFGHFVLKKQCNDLGIILEEINPEELPALSKALSGAMAGFQRPLLAL